MEDCLFCKIIAGDIPSNKLFEDDLVVAFHDINPQAPVHFLVLPKAHIQSAAFIDENNSILAAHCFEIIARLAESEGLHGGFRVIANAGPDSGQTVNHLHFHVLAGTNLGERMVQ